MKQGTKISKEDKEKILEIMKVTRSTEISQENRDKIIEKTRIDKISKVESKEEPHNHSRNPEGDTKKYIDIAKLEISDSIQTGTKINRGRAEEIVELMKQKDLKTQQTEEEETILPCPIACEIELNINEYIDHVIECEKQIEKCKKCGPEFKNNDIHREPGKHSKVTQQFNCMECMQAHAIRVRIINNHNNTCIKLGTEEYTNQKTPEITGKEFQKAYNEDEEIKKLLKENFKKRIIKHSNKQKNLTNPTFNILTILGLITIIYLSTYIIAQAAQMRSDTTNISEIRKDQDKNTNQPELHQNKIKKTKHIQRYRAPSRPKQNRNRKQTEMANKKI